MIGVGVFVFLIALFYGYGKYLDATNGGNGWAISPWDYEQREMYQALAVRFVFFYDDPAALFGYWQGPAPRLPRAYILQRDRLAPPPRWACESPWYRRLLRWVGTVDARFTQGRDVESLALADDWLLSPTEKWKRAYYGHGQDGCRCCEQARDEDTRREELARLTRNYAAFHNIPHKLPPGRDFRT